jgi:hypothetical protein
MIKGSSEEILEAQYCANGDHEGWLVHCASKKLRAGRVMAVNTDEWQALIAESRSFRESLGGSDGRF